MGAAPALPAPACCPAPGSQRQRVTGRPRGTRRIASLRDIRRWFLTRWQGSGVGCVGAGLVWRLGPGRRFLLPGLSQSEGRTQTTHPTLQARVWGCPLCTTLWCPAHRQLISRGLLWGAGWAQSDARPSAGPAISAHDACLQFYAQHRAVRWICARCCPFPASRQPVPRGTVRVGHHRPPGWLCEAHPTRRAVPGSFSPES